MNGQEFHSSRFLFSMRNERRVDRSALIIHCLLRVKHTAYQFSNTFRSSLGRCYKSTLAPRIPACKAIQFQFVCTDVFDLPLKQARFLPIFLPTRVFFRPFFLWEKNTHRSHFIRHAGLELFFAFRRCMHSCNKSCDRLLISGFIIC